MTTEHGDTAEAYSLLLDDQLCFALYAASRAVTARYRPLLDELGLTYPQYLVMLVLWDRDSVSVRDIGTALQLESSTLSPLIKRLETAGLVLRQRRADDERSVTVSLTDEGRSLRNRARCVPTAIGDAMGLTPQQHEAAKDILRLLTTNVSRVG
ncbi:MarR family winged helix-turn-helix transcriptional regulator [Streptomyces minutiscleroticus]|uniref:MarR family transcriptional regulator n=1 Tax=Streptomyces minutiscleroticus TaxID=68238 RepID=A0A918KSY5_9ACTN|nr:MarR family transcriptional regulator [Streptomyces minutiscleroticus]GGX73186.1 MarR family transcriptional regulator [Streptomyces minutiscleroticus]